MASFDSNSNDKFDSTGPASRNRQVQFGQSDTVSSGMAGVGAGGYNDQQNQTSGRDQFSSSANNDDSFGADSQTGQGYGASTNQSDYAQSYGDTTGSQQGSQGTGNGNGSGNEFENNNHSAGNYGSGNDNTSSGYGTSDNFSGNRNDNPYGSENTKPSFGDKVKGTAEVAAGKVTRNSGMVERGQERKVEGNNF
ncbi:related to DDR48-Heat shock protein [Lentinula edodes]|uniref:Related to DDR48-Heat shock protein n=1 Tax=Lentinula edodes TaxID=5353 RepID=A0A1Q3EL87_LENED|nr:related to DDR48-Heat shock protein [Lentinula edodes]